MKAALEIYLKERKDFTDSEGIRERRYETALSGIGAELVTKG